MSGMPRAQSRRLRQPSGADLLAIFQAQRAKSALRQARAVDLLQRTDRPVKQVAQAAGFGNEKSFIRAFRAWTGQSPAAFRRQARPE